MIDKSRFPAVAIMMALAVLLSPSANAEGGGILAELERTPADEAVEKGLAFLAEQQREDGAWISPGYGGPNVGVSSLVLLAFMANGNTPERGRYADVVAKGVDYIMQLPDRGGIIMDKPSHGPMYGHGIATIMLTEVYGMTRSEEVKERLDAAVELILHAQQVDKDEQNRGGWRYQPNSRDSDLSVTGWQLVALRSARNCDLDVPVEAIESAIEYVKRCFHSQTGGFGYQPGGGPQQSRTGTGILALQLSGLYEDEYVMRGADFLLERPLEWNSEHFFYALYHCSNAMYQAGGKYWEFWQPHIEKLLLEQQQADGSWPSSPGDGHANAGGPVYRTAMAALALSIQYRYLPIYQR